MYLLPLGEIYMRRFQWMVERKVGHDNLVQILLLVSSLWPMKTNLRNLSIQEKDWKAKTTVFILFYFMG